MSVYKNTRQCETCGKSLDDHTELCDTCNRWICPGTAVGSMLSDNNDNVYCSESCAERAIGL